MFQPKRVTKAAAGLGTYVGAYAGLLHMLGYCRYIRKVTVGTYMGTYAGLLYT